MYRPEKMHLPMKVDHIDETGNFHFEVTENSPFAISSISKYLVHRFPKMEFVKPEKPKKRFYGIHDRETEKRLSPREQTYIKIDDAFCDYMDLSHYSSKESFEPTMGAIVIRDITYLAEVNGKWKEIESRGFGKHFGYMNLIYAKPTLRDKWVYSVSNVGRAPGPLIKGIIDYLNDTLEINKVDIYKTTSSILL